MKKILSLVLCLALLVPFFALAEKPAEKKPEEILALNYEAKPQDYEGTWVLTQAYAKDKGMLPVPEKALTMEVKISMLLNKLVDSEKYLHADATDLQGTLAFTHDKIKLDDDYKLSVAYDDFTKFVVVGEGECHSTGAAKVKIRDDDEGLFFDVLTGVEIEDMELMNVLGLNADGQLILGYSEDSIIRDPEAVFEYAYVFTKAE